MAPVLTYNDAVSILTALVAQRGRDYVNPKFDVGDMLPSCVYFEDNGIPSCGVGAVIASKGITLLDLEPGENHRSASGFLLGLNSRGILETDSNTRIMLSDFQMIQDQTHDNTWGEALDYALRDKSAE